MDKKYIDKLADLIVKTNWKAVEIKGHMNPVLVYKDIQIFKEFKIRYNSDYICKYDICINQQFVKFNKEESKFLDGIIETKYKVLTDNFNVEKQEFLKKQLCDQLEGKGEGDWEIVNFSKNDIKGY